MRSDAAGRVLICSGVYATDVDVLPRRPHAPFTLTLTLPSRHVQEVGYDAAGRVLNYSGVAAPTPAEIAADAQKVRASALAAAAECQG